ncbi:hypothetical protein [Streptacidiphilus sp. P02-A3a]|uniref:MmyB family transcriptional regulator n=1 Tax=Streptacidiphilus sp. P02-A3a TaxID=2704468 RepID=UPI001CDBD8E1|nr:hypothetical protein [Streptacidiphilus sp. P02-A3a]
MRRDEAAAAHLFRVGPSAFRTSEAATTVAPELLRLMDGMRDVPAFVVGAAQDVLAAKAMARELYRGFARYDNLLRMIFLDPFAREFYADWDHAARIAVGNLRASSSPPGSTCPCTARNPAAPAPMPWACSASCPSRKRP